MNERIDGILPGICIARTAPECWLRNHTVSKRLARSFSLLDQLFSRAIQDTISFSWALSISFISISRAFCWRIISELSIRQEVGYQKVERLSQWFIVMFFFALFSLLQIDANWDQLSATIQMPQSMSQVGTRLMFFLLAMDDSDSDKIVSQAFQFTVGESSGGLLHLLDKAQTTWKAFKVGWAASVF